MYEYKAPSWIGIDGFAWHDIALEGVASERVCLLVPSFIIMSTHHPRSMQKLHAKSTTTTNRPRIPISSFTQQPKARSPHPLHSHPHPTTHKSFPPPTSEAASFVSCNAPLIPSSGPAPSLPIESQRSTIHLKYARSKAQMITHLQRSPDRTAALQCRPPLDQILAPDLIAVMWSSCRCWLLI